MQLSKLWSMWRPDRRIQFDPEYQKAHALKNTYRPTKSSDQYGWVADYAKYVLGEFRSAERTLDEKAESVMKLFGSGTGLLTFGAFINLPKFSLLTTILLGVALLLALAAIFAAAWVRVPRQTYLPPSVASALAYVEKYEDVSETRFLAQWHLACEGLRLSLRLKSSGVRIATWLGFWSIFVVAMSLCSAIMWPVEQPKKNDSQTKLEHREMSSGIPIAATFVPDPSGASQTPDPAIFLNPQRMEAFDPAAAAEPQSIQFPAGDGAAPLIGPAVSAEPQAFFMSADDCSG
jgi:hypothetical protein